MMVHESSNIIRVAQISTGFAEVPNSISMNIYAQGCGIHCPGCQNYQIQNFEGGIELNYNQIKKSIDEHSLCNWICWLGGDATFQAESFKEINRLISIDYPNKKICLYTGRLFNDITDLLTSVDLVIDGPWMGTPVTEIGSNQKIYLNDRNGWKLIDSWETLTKIFTKNS